VDLVVLREEEFRLDLGPAAEGEVGEEDPVRLFLLGLAMGEHQLLRGLGRRDLPQEGRDERRRLVDVEEDDAAFPEAAQRPAQQPERLLRRPPHGHVEPRRAAVVPPAWAAAAEPRAGVGQRRRAQDLHRRPAGSLSSLRRCCREEAKRSEAKSKSFSMHAPGT